MKFSIRNDNVHTTKVDILVSKYIPLAYHTMSWTTGVIGGRTLSLVLFLSSFFGTFQEKTWKALSKNFRMISWKLNFFKFYKVNFKTNFISQLHVILAFI